MNQKKYFLQPERRALNLIWTAAKDYHFTPSFIAFWPNGEPDFYLNSIIGYVQKWYDSKILNSLFETIHHSFFHETFDGLLWIGLENCAYKKEVLHRPILLELRKEHAKEFFQQEKTQSRQQWMAQNSLVYTLQAAQWNIVLGKSPGILNPWEQKLFQALQYDPSWTSQELKDYTLKIFHQFFGSHSSVYPRRFIKWKLHLQQFLRKKMPSHIIRTETLLASRSFSDTSNTLSVHHALRLKKKNFSSQRNDLLYIEGCFGKPLYPEEFHLQIEQELCTDAHKDCHLYFTDGSPDTTAADPIVKKVRSDAQIQHQKNQEHFRSHRLFYQNSILRLRRQIQNALLIYPQPLHLRSRSGSLFPSQVWRGIYLDDPYVFMETTEDAETDFSVDLMLDASASRLESQETIAAQAYIIAKSLQSCDIPVQIFSFLSTRGYTIMRLFSGYTDGADSLQNIFQYFAAGWNRDGLAFRGAGQLMISSPAKHRLLIVLTDASPNDDHRIPSDPSKKHFIRQDYSGHAGIQDTKKSVRSLRKKDIHVSAILTGNDGDTKAAREIFGQDFVRIEKMEQFSSAAGTLIQKQIEKISR